MHNKNLQSEVAYDVADIGEDKISVVDSLLFDMFGPKIIEWGCLFGSFRALTKNTAPNQRVPAIICQII